MSQRIITKVLVAIHKGKVTLKLKKLAYAGMCLLDLTKVLMYELYFDYIKNTYDSNSRLLFTDTDSLMYEIKTEKFYEDHSKGKKVFDFRKYSAQSKCYDDSKKLVVRKIKNKTAGVAIKEFVGLKPNIYSFLVDDSSKHKKGKGVNKTVLQQWFMITKMFCWIINFWDIRWIESKVKFIE